ncbi:MAG: DegT/DnrJ/EryC1/StrS family aminotransferase [Bacteroidetes bacterium]|nr:DegT/DnrJ/EryC1/StrS family aminotransferase [Bacteroidota bacterium]MCW5897437.1 DegT/DnrJ/EryC1/StrS family aminotransferase [Bacteroidota bacterium]
MNIPIAKTVFSDADLEAILKPLKSGWVVQGPLVKEFEEKWSQFTGAKHSIATSNCTTALHLSLAALGIGQGDEVIVPAFTWVASANAVESLGAKPVFCDINLATFNIEPRQIETKITSRTKAIMPVHLFGLAADMDEIPDIARRHNLLIVEDAACGFASRYKGVHVGNFGTTGCFSFHPRKAITTGEGGMITTNDATLAGKLRAMRDHGATTSDHQRHLGSKPYLLPDFPYLGFNYRLTDIQASIGSSQMDRAQDIHRLRTEIAARYDVLLAGIPWLRKPFAAEAFVHGYQAYVCLFQPEPVTTDNVSEINRLRNSFMEYLQEHGVSTRPGTHGVHMLAHYSQKYSLMPDDFPNAWIADQCSIAFPLFANMSNSEFDLIRSVVSDYPGAR